MNAGMLTFASVLSVQLSLSLFSTRWLLLRVLRVFFDTSLKNRNFIVFF